MAQWLSVVVQMYVKRDDYFAPPTWIHHNVFPIHSPQIAVNKLYKLGHAVFYFVFCSPTTYLSTRLFHFVFCLVVH